MGSTRPNEGQRAQRYCRHTQDLNHVGRQRVIIARSDGAGGLERKQVHGHDGHALEQDNEILGDAEPRGAHGDDGNEAAGTLTDEVEGGVQDEEQDDSQSEVLQPNATDRLHPGVIDHPSARDGNG